MLCPDIFEHMLLDILVPEFNLRRALPGKEVYRHNLSPRQPSPWA